MILLCEGRILLCYIFSVFNWMSSKSLCLFCQMFFFYHDSFEIVMITLKQSHANAPYVPLTALSLSVYFGVRIVLWIFLKTLWIEVILHLWWEQTRQNTEMGNYVSNNAVYLAAKRALMRYNIESRTFKELEKQTKKPLVAPKHEAEFIDYHKSLKGMNLIDFFAD